MGTVYKNKDMADVWREQEQGVVKFNQSCTCYQGNSVKSSYQNMTTTDVRRDEKHDMVTLNNKLAVYVQKVRNLGANGGDSAAFLMALRSIEDEVNRLKKMYESELETLRKKLEEANRYKNDGLSEAERLRRAAAEFEDRFRIETDRNATMMSDIKGFQCRITEMERELVVARSAVSGPESQLVAVQTNLARETARAHQMTQQLDQEKARNKQLEDKIKGLEQKLGFNDQRNNAQLKDAGNRLDQSKKVISDLEARAKDLERRNASLPELLEQMRCKTEQDLQYYRRDVEAVNKNNNTVLKKQLDDQDRALQQLRSANSKLEKDNSELTIKVRSMEAQVRDIENQKASLENQLQQERTRSSEQGRALERKLKEMQDVLFVKMQEVNVGKDVQVSLRSEIEAMRVVLEEEERRLGNLGGVGVKTGANYGYSMTANTYNASAMANTSGGVSRSYQDHSAALSKMKLSSSSKALTTTNKGSGTEYQYAYNFNGTVPTWARTGTSVNFFPKLSTETICAKCAKPVLRQSLSRAS